MKFLLLYFILGLVVTIFVHISEYLTLKGQFDNLKKDLNDHFKQEIKVSWGYDLDFIGVIAIIIFWPAALYVIYARQI